MSLFSALSVGASGMSAQRARAELLVENLHVIEVVVGENFTFGKKAAGNVAALRRAGVL